MSDAERVLDYLKELGIATRVMAHAPANTMADCAEIDRAMGSLTPKNLFLTTKNGRRACLCLARPDARFHTSDISRQAGYTRLSFAPEDRLMALLRCRPGSASPLGLIFPEARPVALLVDEALRDAPVLSFHPCDNTKTVAMAGGDFFDRFLPEVGVRPVYVAFDGGESP